MSAVRGGPVRGELHAPGPAGRARGQVGDGQPPDDRAGQPQFAAVADHEVRGGDPAGAHPSQRCGVADPGQCGDAPGPDPPSGSRGPGGRNGPKARVSRETTTLTVPNSCAIASRVRPARRAATHCCTASGDGYGPAPLVHRETSWWATPSRAAMSVTRCPRRRACTHRSVRWRMVAASATVLPRCFEAAGNGPYGSVAARTVRALTPARAAMSGTDSPSRRRANHSSAPTGSPTPHTPARGHGVDNRKQARRLRRCGAGSCRSPAGNGGGRAAWGPARPGYRRCPAARTRAGRLEQLNPRRARTGVFTGGEAPGYPQVGTPRRRSPQTPTWAAPAGFLRGG